MIFGGILLLVGLALLFIQTPLGKRQVVKIAENQVNKILNGTLSVGKIRGNFFSHLELENLLLLSDEQDTIAFIAAINLKYKLKSLLDNEIKVNKIEIEKPYVFLEQLNDSSWSFAHWLKPTPEDSTPSSFNMLIAVDKLSLIDGEIVIGALDSIIPSKIDNLQLMALGSYSAESYGGEIEKFSFNACQPDVVLQKLALKVKGTPQMIELSSFSLQTVQNEINISGLYHFDLQEKSSINLSTHPIILEEFAWILPDISTQAKPELSLSATLVKSEIDGEIKLMENENGLFLQFNSDKLLDALLADSSDIIIPDYELNLRVNNLDIAYWLDNSDMKYSLSGDLKAKGSGITPETACTELGVHLRNSKALRYNLDEIRLNGFYDKGDVDASLYGQGDFGEITAHPNVTGILGQNPRYQLDAKTYDLNPALLLNDPGFDGAINMALNVSGIGFDYKTLHASADLNLFPSRFFGMEIDSIQTRLDYDRQNIIIHKLNINALGAYVTAEGNYNLIDTSDLKLFASIDTLEKIKKFLDIPEMESLQSSLKLNAHLNGKPENLQTNLDLSIGYTQFESYYLDSLCAKALASIAKDSMTINGCVNAHHVVIQDFTFDTLSLGLSTDLTNYTTDLNVHGPMIDLSLQGDVRLTDTIVAILQGLEFAYRDYAWEQCDSLARIEIWNDSYWVDNFILFNKNDHKQKIDLHGVINRNGKQDFNAIIENLDVAKLLPILEINQPIVGELNLALAITSEADNPQIIGNVYIDKASFAEYGLDSLMGKLIYRDQETKAFFSLIPKDSGKLYLAARMPAHIALDSMRFDVVPQDEDSISVKLIISELPLAMIRMFLPVDGIGGSLNSHIDLTGTFGNPKVNGYLNIPTGSVENELYGVNYQNITANININQDLITIDTLHIESLDKKLLTHRVGTMNAKGEAAFDQSLLTGELTQANMEILFDQFRPINHKQYNTELDGKIRLQSDQDSVYFSGNITIPETQVYLPAVINLLGGSSTSSISKPLLVQEMERNRIDSSTLAVVEKPETESDTSSRNFDFLDNLRGDIKVKIPHNMWIRNDDMRIELSGDVDLIKHRDFFEIFGNIDIVRGQYELMSKVFLIKEGTITFQGGQELNPLLSLEAIYTFRDPERNKKELKLDLSGNLEKPELAFSVDGESVSEGDAISYIVFGMSMDALTSSQHQAVSFSMDAADMAKSAASSLVSSELTKILGSLLNVDYIELKSNNSFTGMSLNVGKYITNNIFVSYEQNIGAKDDENTSNMTFRLEYEILKFLFLELTVPSKWEESGGDLIFKFNSKQ